MSFTITQPANSSAASSQPIRHLTDVSHLHPLQPELSIFSQANNAPPLNSLRMTAIESGSSSEISRAAAGITPTKKSYIHYYDKVTKQLWKISIQTSDGDYIKQTDAFLQRTREELVNRDLLKHLNLESNTIRYQPHSNECIINNTTIPIQFTDEYISEYDTAIANTNFDTDIVVRKENRSEKPKNQYSEETHVNAAKTEEEQIAENLRTGKLRKEEEARKEKEANPILLDLNNHQQAESI